MPSIEIPQEILSATAEWVGFKKREEIDRLDALLVSGDATQEEYDKKIAKINTWAQQDFILIWTKERLIREKRGIIEQTKREETVSELISFKDSL